MLNPLGLLGAKFIYSLLPKESESTIGELAKKLLKKGNIWVIKYIDDLHTLDVLFSMRKAVGAKIICDIDDNIWQCPIGNAAMANKIGRAHV